MRKLDCIFMVVDLLKEKVNYNKARIKVTLEKLTLIYISVHVCGS